MRWGLGKAATPLTHHAAMALSAKSSSPASETSESRIEVEDNN